MNEVPVFRHMHMRGIIPVSVVDEERAVRFPFWQRSSGADRAAPSIDHDEVERAVRQAENGSGIGRKRRVVEGIGLCVGMFERDVAQIDICPT